ncbi:uncharacterized protein LOC111599584 [Drosophila hydei]|uniref:Uncharacterized protein LOC111599584 n=1 Tax=Drosophila hydei TaxID=7224 RepID=A0A6J1M2W3_DROHY|nr:uncharacterized protein LOC111599584 [Drosophila hydei]
MMQVQQGFQHFVEFFQVHLSNASVDFIHDVDLSGFIKLLELPKYTSVVKTLNAGINIDTDVDLDGKGQSGGDGDGVDPTKQPSQQRPQMKQLSADTLSAPTELPKEQQQKHQKQQQNDKAQKAKQREQHSDTSSLAHCHQLAEQLAYDYNKSALFWPCPQMKSWIWGDDDDDGDGDGDADVNESAMCSY